MNQGANGNFLYNGLNPDLLGMDEDYDAPDLENWYLALQSADGNVVIPSFHRPGVVDPGDWSTAAGRMKILRPRTADGNDIGTFPDLNPDTTGRIKYDVDNDGDGVTDAVWVDLGKPAQRDATGKLFKPLFAFTVLGLNGRLPLNTAGNIQGASCSPASTTNSATCTIARARATRHSTTRRTWGYSVNEINPLYALQNAPDPTYTTNSQIDNAGVPVALTQLRNLLTGTRIPSPTQTGTNINQDTNAVLVGGQSIPMGNNLIDSTDPGPFRGTTGVAGRWGEEGFIPNSTSASVASYPTFNYYYFNNTIRAGRSNTLQMFPAGSYPPRLEWDASDDDFDTFDFFASPNPENVDLTDSAGGYLLPSERIRRFVEPIDPTGAGRMSAFAQIRFISPDHSSSLPFHPLASPTTTLTTRVPVHS